MFLNWQINNYYNLLLTGIEYWTKNSGKSIRNERAPDQKSTKNNNFTNTNNNKNLQLKTVRDLSTYYNTCIHISTVSTLLKFWRPWTLDVFKADSCIIIIE